MGQLLDQWRKTAPSADGFYAPLPVYLAEVLDVPAILDPDAALSEDRRDAFLHDLAHFAIFLSNIENNFAPGLPSWGPHWRYLSRTAHVAELIDAVTLSTACRELETRLSGFSDTEIAAMCRHQPLSDPDRTAELAALLDATHQTPERGMLLAAITDGIDHDYGGQRPENGLLPQSDRLIALITAIRKGRDVEAPPLDPALRTWIDHKTVAPSGPPRDKPKDRRGFFSRFLRPKPSS